MKFIFFQKRKSFEMKRQETIEKSENPLIPI